MSQTSYFSVTLGIFLFLIIFLFLTRFSRSSSLVEDASYRQICYIRYIIIYIIIRQINLPITRRPLRLNIRRKRSDLPLVEYTTTCTHPHFTRTTPNSTSKIRVPPISYPKLLGPHRHIREKIVHTNSPVSRGKLKPIAPTLKFKLTATRSPISHALERTPVPKMRLGGQK
jgi:hypothetical protein